ncbi:Formate--tetrahydrofolate ligase [bacterium HR23]|nr:Formate--tetrahydrofolate ligase [bacterium HR23]
MPPLEEAVRRLNLDPSDLEQYGCWAYKVPLSAFPSSPPRGRLVVVTGITPTPLGEGKTVTAIGLADALSRLGEPAVVTLRQPSLGPLLGRKGGGTGGGMARLVPEEEINLHFTGDAHAVASAHNLLSALVENALYHKSLPDLDPRRVVWERVTDVQDRALRHIVVGLGGTAHGVPRESGFVLDAASEIMAVLSLAQGYADLRARLERMVVAWRADGTPVTARDIGGVGALLVLLRRALWPNLVQTAEGTPALVHTGPFGNVSHGCSSVLADRLGVLCADWVVTEAGFGSDLGLEKFMHLKVRQGGVVPSAAVLVASLRALKRHGGVALSQVEQEDLHALQQGMANLEAHLDIIQAFGLPVVVALNSFPTDSPAETRFFFQETRRLGVPAVLHTAFRDGGAGAQELAQAVQDIARQPSQPRFLYPAEAPLPEKVETLARRVYGAGEVRWDDQALDTLRRLEKAGMGRLLACVAKTHLSLSHNPALHGRPHGYTFPIRQVSVWAGAGWAYFLTGEVQVLPGLPAHPNALDMDLDEAGRVIGIR